MKKKWNAKTSKLNLITAYFAFPLGLIGLAGMIEAIAAGEYDVNTPILIGAILMLLFLLIYGWIYLNKNGRIIFIVLFLLFAILKINSISTNNQTNNNSSIVWSNGILKLEPPSNWSKVTELSEGEIVAFVADNDQSITLYKQNFACADMARQAGQSNIDSNGYMYNILPIEEYDINLKMIIKCIENSQGTFTLVGVAPENDFSNSESIFKKTLSSFDFEN